MEIGKWAEANCQPNIFDGDCEERYNQKIFLKEVQCFWYSRDIKWKDASLDSLLRE